MGQCSKASREIWARCCSIATSISFPCESMVDTSDNRTACSSSISAFIYLMMSRYTTIGACLHYWYYSRAVHSCSVAMCDVCCVVLAAVTEGCFKIGKWLALLSTCSGQIQKCILGTSLLMKVTERRLECKAEPCGFFLIYSVCKILFSGCSTRSTYVYWTVHHCNSWRIKDQLDVTCYFISLLMCSTCFGH